MTTATQRQPLDTSDLWSSVDRLTKDRRQRLVRDAPGGKTTIEHVDVPSLWTQLVEALASSNSGDGGRPTASTAGSRSPLDLSIEALLSEMSARLRAGLVKLGHRPRVLAEQTLAAAPRRAPQLGDDRAHPIIDPDLGGKLAEAAARTLLRRDTVRLRHDVLSDLRQYAAAVVATNDQDAVDECARRYAGWVWRAEEMLTADDESIDLRAIRGHACPQCDASYIERIEASTDPRAPDGVERFRDAALVIAFHDGQVQHVTCRACGAGWWRGDDVEELSAKIRENAAMPPRSTPSPVEARRDDRDANAGGRLSGRTDDWFPWPTHGGSAA